MSKIAFLSVLVGISYLSYGQEKPLVKGDTLQYGGVKFYKGAILKLGYGTGANKDFAFINQGAGMAMTSNLLPATYSKREVEVKRFFKSQGKMYAIAKPTGDPFGMTIDVEGAIDNKEIIVY